MATDGEAVGALPSRTPAIEQPALRMRVGQILNRHPVVGLAVGVISEEGTEFACHGYADLASRAPVTERTVFRIGSITKTMTAVAVMQLHEEGRIDLDAPADEYLRAYRLIWRAIASGSPRSVIC